MKKYFADFDFRRFWADDNYSLKEFTCAPPSDELVRSIEQELGYKLPASYIELMKMHNGGIIKRNSFPMKEPTARSKDHVVVLGIYCLSRNKSKSIAGSGGTRFLIEEWDYPDYGIYIGYCPNDGRDHILLDYRKCGNQGEPEVVHVDEENGHRITYMAKDFETFIKGLRFRICYI